MLAREGVSRSEPSESDRQVDEKHRAVSPFAAV